MPRLVRCQESPFTSFFKCYPCTAYIHQNTGSPASHTLLYVGTLKSSETVYMKTDAATRRILNLVYISKFPFMGINLSIVESLEHRVLTPICSFQYRWQGGPFKKGPRWTYGPCRMSTDLQVGVIISLFHHIHNPWSNCLLWNTVLHGFW